MAGVTARFAATNASRLGFDNARAFARFRIENKHRNPLLFLKTLSAVLAA
jgi:hypothetical protein